MPKNVVFASMGIAGLVALAAIVDLAAGFPFGQYSMLMDGLYLVGSGLVIYMGIETLREMK